MVYSQIIQSRSFELIVRLRIRSFRAIELSLILNSSYMKLNIGVYKLTTRGPRTSIEALCLLGPIAPSLSPFKAQKIEIVMHLRRVLCDAVESLPAGGQEIVAVADDA